MCSEEHGKDLRGVESLQRRHQDMIRDISAIEDKLKVLIVSSFCILCLTWL